MDRYQFRPMGKRWPWVLAAQAGLNVIDYYRCPRCGGKMEKKVDSRQRHIWYETCGDCNGSFFDAGEFLDLSQLTISDVFKRLTTSDRE